MRKTGFTMIEFLVVAALIGILATLGLGAYTKSLSRGRDAKRISDMKEVQKTFELYYSLKNQYDTNCKNMFTPDTGSEPTPPAGGKLYFWKCDVTSYEYCAQLENGADYGNEKCSFGDVDEGCLNYAGPVGDPNNSYCVYSVQ